MKIYKVPILISQLNKKLKTLFPNHSTVHDRSTKPTHLIVTSIHSLPPPNHEHLNYLYLPTYALFFSRSNFCYSKRCPILSHSI